MRSIHAFAVAAGLALATLSAGCAAESDPDAAESEDAIQTGFASPGADLGRATTVVADGDGAFVAFDRTLEHRAVGKVQSLGKTDIGFEDLVVSKGLAAYVTASFVKTGGSKVVLHVLERASGWKEIRTEDLSTNPASFRHPLVVIGEDTFAVGVGGQVAVISPDGKKSFFGGPSSKFGKNAVFSLYPGATPTHFFAGVDNGDLFDVDTRTSALTLQPKREGKGTTIDTIFDAKTKTWISVDFEGLKINGLDGKLLRRVDLETKKGRFISDMTLLPNGKLLVAHESEKSQERYVLATYDLASLKRTELGTFDGMIRQLTVAPGKVLFAFSPSGAAGFNSRVWFARALTL